MTTKWWKDVWSSPMTEQFIRVDAHALFRLALLVNAFWVEPSTKLAAEIRIQQQAFGLTPLDRSRLQWNIEQANEAHDKGEKRRRKQAKPVSGNDPRGVLE
jgi:hypothetical protein